MSRLVTLLTLIVAAEVAYAQPPAPTPMIGPGVSAVGCFIQTDFVVGGKHNFELTALEGRETDLWDRKCRIATVRRRCHPGRADVSGGIPAGRLLDKAYLPEPEFG